MEPRPSAGLRRVRGSRLADSALSMRRHRRHEPTATPDGPDPVLAMLVAAARAGDREAFDELVRRTHVATYTLALRLMGDPEDACDVVQEAYLRAFRGIRRFRGDAAFATWMYRITANCAATHLGRRRRHRHDVLEPEAVVVDARPEVDPVVRHEAGVLRDRVEEALMALPPRLRQVVVLRDVYDLTHEAIAAELGISETAAKVRLHRARRKLRDEVFAGYDLGAARAV